MKRRTFITTGVAAPLAAAALGNTPTQPPKERDTIRAAFPRLEKDIYLNAAALMPLSSFAQAGLQNYIHFQQTGDNTYLDEMLSQIKGLFGQLVGAQEEEIGLVYCTKAGEQIAIDAVDHIKKDGNIVTNDLHFSGSLHNLVGLKKQGRDVRIIQARDWKVSVDEMIKAIDNQTALVNVALVSNINGHREDIGRITKAAHAHGALVYADIIQAAGVVPLNLRELDVDVAACSTYKWLYGVYGSGFLYVRRELQGTQLPDTLFPGRVRYNYAPWTTTPNSEKDGLEIHPRQDAGRYQEGHVNYMGYCAAYEGLKFLLNYGVDNALKHSTQLNMVLKEKLNPTKFPCITPDVSKSPIITFLTQQPDEIKKRCRAARIVVTHAGNRIRVAPALYNTAADMDALAEVLNG